MVISAMTVRSMDGASNIQGGTCCVSESEHHGEPALVDISKEYAWTV